MELGIGIALNAEQLSGLRIQLKTNFVMPRKWLITKNMDITLESLITRIILHASLIRKNQEYDHSRVACAFEEIAAALNMVNQFRDAAKMVPDHIVEANKMVPVVKDSLTTQIDTPRTDAASFSSRDPLELLQTSQQLERELAASQAEVDRLRVLLDKAIPAVSSTVFMLQLRDELNNTN